MLLLQISTKHVWNRLKNSIYKNFYNFLLKIALWWLIFKIFILNTHNVQFDSWSTYFGTILLRVSAGAVNAAYLHHIYISGLYGHFDKMQNYLLKPKMLHFSIKLFIIVKVKFVISRQRGPFRYCLGLHQHARLPALNQNQLADSPLTLTVTRNK